MKYALILLVIFGIVNTVSPKIHYQTLTQKVELGEIPDFTSIQDPKERSELFIKTFAAYAHDQHHETGIPASIKLAQAALESSWGQSKITVLGHNHFGIKCWDGKGIKAKDDDYKVVKDKQGKPVLDKKGKPTMKLVNSCFRKYKSPSESWEDHSLFLKENTRYAGLFKLVDNMTDPLHEQWARGLKEAGYATDPKYATLLIEIIEKHKLYEYDYLEN